MEQQIPQIVWTRLEPHARARTLQHGLDAEVHDPLWFLVRQWQLLEFWGEDSGSPISAEYVVNCSPIARYLPNPEGKNPVTLNAEGGTFDRKVPLETLIEREPLQREPLWGQTTDAGQEQWQLRQIQHMRLAAESGMQFLRLMDLNSVGTFQTTILEKFPLLPLTDTEQEYLNDVSDVDTVRFLGVMARRVPDGVLLRSIFKIVFEAGSLDQLKGPYKSRVETGVADWRALSESDRNALRPTVDQWQAWYKSLISEPQQADGPSWVPQRLEYQALISTYPRPGEEVVLNTAEYADGHLDWYSFDVLPAGSLGGQPTDATPKEFRRTATPTPVTFHGMPASRYWEFEDANIDFGELAAGEQQLAHLILIEFGLVSGDDWFVLPVLLPVGSLCSTNLLQVTDTFGRTTTIESARKVEASRPHSPDFLPWNLFQLSLDNTPVSGTSRSSPDALFLPPTLGRSLQGKTIEEVLFLRDEMANMVWGVERTIESALGRPLNLSEASFRSRKDTSTQSLATNASQKKRYRLVSDIPPHWVPMLPVPVTVNDAQRLGLQTGRQGKGRVMTELWTINKAGTPVYGEEVPREGVRISRAYQYTRWTNGQSYLWVGRRNEVGRGEGSSGLVFDQLELPTEPSDQNRT